jgi:hypothetical protein
MAEVPGWLWGLDSFSCLVIGFRTWLCFPLGIPLWGVCVDGGNAVGTVTYQNPTGLLALAHLNHT